ncbi:hypothetical protein CVCC1112_4269 [Paenarthrobacter nicotinovorans]|uniref:DUF6953 family protein n=1 Tax=Paenarthrobacter nicotinovorans TaxID=29320 RepID=UPI0007CBE829|nr:hypothetical protein [Paenarthrobacter nicotinovorans]GAT89610.1 hypothetical protein CVCC1112_4269 [Paenarthrobacter nicotinovorans]
MTAEINEEPEIAPATAASIGAWLLNRIETAAPSSVAQSTAVTEIRNTFGTEWSYQNNNGNWAIDKDVLKEFNKLKYPNIQWNSGSQYWHIVSDEQLAYIQNQAELKKQRKAEVAARVAQREKEVAARLAQLEKDEAR